VNALIALFDPNHVQHQAMRSWFSANAKHGWASCPITQNGLVRVTSQPSYPGSIPVGQAVARLRTAAQSSAHEFWPCDVALIDPEIFDVTALLGPNQVTDAYLLGLAVARGGRLATFDSRITTTAVPTANQDNLVLIGQADLAA
jgi:toxin-antitoxin system PIN domain toxin